MSPPHQPPSKIAALLHCYHPPPIHPHLWPTDFHCLLTDLPTIPPVISHTTISPSFRLGRLALILGLKSLWLYYKAQLGLASTCLLRFLLYVSCSLYSTDLGFDLASREAMLPSFWPKGFSRFCSLYLEYPVSSHHIHSNSFFLPPSLSVLISLSLLPLSFQISSLSQMHTHAHTHTNYTHLILLNSYPSKLISRESSGKPFPTPPSHPCLWQVHWLSTSRDLLQFIITVSLVWLFV